MQDEEFVVSEAEAGLRLDELVTRHLPGRTKGEVVRAIEYRNILLNGRVARKGVKVSAGNTVCIKDMAANMVYPNADIHLSYIYEDEYLLAVNKPAGMPSYPNRPHERETLANGLVAAYPSQASIGDTPLAAGVLHRLDTNTSGLTLVARTQEVFDALRAAFSERAIEKTYLACVQGRVTEAGRLDHELVHNPLRRGQMLDAAQVKNPDRPMRAVTRFKPIKQFANATLLEVGIRTGVTHQIRCQLALSGHPIIGDELYGARAVEGFARHWLHASAIEFTHPVTREAVRIEAAVPRELSDLLKTLAPEA